MILQRDIFEVSQVADSQDHWNTHLSLEPFMPVTLKPWEWDPESLGVDLETLGVLPP